MNHSFQVQGMTCGHCEMAVKKAIQRIDGQAVVEINRNTGEVRVQSDLARESVSQAIAEEGYQVA